MNVYRSNKRKWFHIKKNKKNRRYLTETLTNADYAYDLALLAQIESLLRNLEQAAGGIGFYMNANKREFIFFKPEKAISTFEWQASEIKWRPVLIPWLQYLIYGIQC